MSKVIAVCGMKGGVGKSSLAVNLAWLAANPSARRTLLWDVDAQGAASFLAGHDGRDGKARRIFRRDADPRSMIEPTRWPRLGLLAADLSLRQLSEDLAAEKPKRLRKLLASIADDYDRVVIDAPPGLNELSDQVFRGADLLVVPIVPTPLALRAFDQLRDHVQHHHGGKPGILPVFSLVDRRKKLHRETVALHPDWPVIPQASIVEQMAVRCAPLPDFAPATPAARAFAAVWTAVERRLLD